MADFSCFDFNKNGNDLVRLQINEFRKKVSVDIRKHFTNDAGSTWQPTQKGAQIPLSELNHFINSLINLREELTKTGVITS